MVQMTFFSKAHQARSRANSLHRLSYLTTNDHRSPGQRDLRQDIEQSLEDYYSRVPLSDVTWCCDYVRQCLFDTVVNPSFNPYKVRHAFRLVERMIMNLYCWPWRKEFHRICLYCGLFKTQISSHIVGYKNLFLCIGYELIGGSELSIPQHKLPINNSLLAALSFDCIMAEVVCTDIIEVYLRLNQNSSTNQEAVAPQSEDFSWTKTYLRDRYDKLREKSLAILVDHTKDLTSLSNSKPNSCANLPRHITDSESRNSGLYQHQGVSGENLNDFSHGKEQHGGDHRISTNLNGHHKVTDFGLIDDYDHEDDEVKDLLQNCRLEDELNRQQIALERKAQRHEFHSSSNNQQKARSSSLLRSLAPSSMRSSTHAEPKSKSKFYVTERSYEPGTGQILHRFSRPSISPIPASSDVSSNDRADRSSQASCNYPQQSYL